MTFFGWVSWAAFLSFPWALNWLFRLLCPMKAHELRPFPKHFRIVLLILHKLLLIYHSMAGICCESGIYNSTSIYINWKICKAHSLLLKGPCSICVPCFESLTDTCFFHNSTTPPDFSFGELARLCWQARVLLVILGQKLVNILYQLVCFFGIDDKVVEQRLRRVLHRMEQLWDMSLEMRCCVSKSCMRYSCRREQTLQRCKTTSVVRHSI